MKTKLLLCVAAFAAGVCGQGRGPLPSPESGNVTLSLEEYDRLVELASRSVKPPDVAPVPYTIKSAAMKFQVSGEKAVGSIQLDGEVFLKGAAKVPLLRGMTLLDAHRPGAQLPLEQVLGTHFAILPSGEFSVELDAGLPLAIEAGRASLRFPVPSAGAARLSIDIPGDHTVVNLNPGLIISRQSANGHTIVEAALRPGEPATLWWAVRETAPQAAAREIRFLSDVKTLASVTEAELNLTVLANITVVQGDPVRFDIILPAGYEMAGATGSSLDAADVVAGVLSLRVSNPTLRSHQFLISLTKPAAGAKADIPIITVKDTQRETGEVLVEGEGTMELTADESGSLKRMDIKEVSSYLRQLGRTSLFAAFRYHRQTGETPALALSWTRFPDTSIVPAVAETAQVTTMVTSGGRSLTEIKLMVRNVAQPFLKVALPAGASIVSADVAGERVKPLQGPDGDRVPLLRSGFRPSGPYQVSFVYMDSGAPFAKKGGSELILPKMDVPVAVIHWEVFLPDRYKVANFGGDVGVDHSLGSFPTGSVLEGQIAGFVIDPTGAVIPNAQVTVTDLASGGTKTAQTNSAGYWLVSNVASGRIRITVASPGFQASNQIAVFNSARPVVIRTKLQVGAVSETVEVTASATEPAPVPREKQESRDTRKTADTVPLADQPASPNVVELQKRLAGVLPIPVEVPRAGTSFRFIRPLVVSEETKVSFTYKTK